MANLTNTVAHPVTTPHILAGFRQRAAHLVSRLVASTALRTTTRGVADLSDRERADLGLSHRLEFEPGLGAINMARGYEIRSQLGAPFGR